jgi:hypothetical protein
MISEKEAVQIPSILVDACDERQITEKNNLTLL